MEVCRCRFFSKFGQQGVVNFADDFARLDRNFDFTFDVLAAAVHQEI